MRTMCALSRTFSSKYSRFVVEMTACVLPKKYSERYPRRSSSSSLITSSKSRIGSCPVSPLRYSLAANF